MLSHYTTTNNLVYYMDFRQYWLNNEFRSWTSFIYDSISAYLHGYFLIHCFLCLLSGSQKSLDFVRFEDSFFYLGATNITSWRIVGLIQSSEIVLTCILVMILPRGRDFLVMDLGVVWIWKQLPVWYMIRENSHGGVWNWECLLKW